MEFIFFNGKLGAAINRGRRLLDGGAY